jgi:hypothetical protein
MEGVSWAAEQLFNSERLLIKDTEERLNEKFSSLVMITDMMM